MLTRYRAKFYWHAILFSSVFIGLITLSWFLFTLILQSGVQIRLMKRELALLKLKTDQIGIISREYNRVSQDIALLNASMLQEGARLPFIMLVERLAAENSVYHVIGSTEYVSLENKEELDVQKHIYPISFNINITGEFSNVLRFIYLLENEQYNTDLLRIQLSEAGDGLRTSSRAESGLPLFSNQVKAQIQAQVYSL